MHAKRRRNTWDKKKSNGAFVSPFLQAWLVHIARKQKGQWDEKTRWTGARCKRYARIVTSTLSSLTECRRNDTGEKKNTRFWYTDRDIARLNFWLNRTHYQQDRNIRMCGAAQKWRADLFGERIEKKRCIMIAFRVFARQKKIIRNDNLVKCKLKFLVYYTCVLINRVRNSNVKLQQITYIFAVTNKRKIYTTVVSRIKANWFALNYYATIGNFIAFSLDLLASTSLKSDYNRVFIFYGQNYVCACKTNVKINIESLNMIKLIRTVSIQLSGNWL